jgi:uncharacterized protein YsxB (DUF464 family)
MESEIKHIEKLIEELKDKIFMLEDDEFYEQNYKTYQLMIEYYIIELKKLKNK